MTRARIPFSSDWLSRNLKELVSNAYRLLPASRAVAFAAGVVSTLLLTGVVADLFRRDPAPADKPHRAEPTKRIARADWSETDLLRVSVPDLSPKLAARISSDYGVPVVSADDPRVGTIDPKTGKAVLGLLYEFQGGSYPWGFDAIVTYESGAPVGVILKARPEPRVLLSPRVRVGLWAERCWLGPSGLCPPTADAGAFARWDAIRLRGGRYLEAQLDAGTLAGKPMVRTRAAIAFEWDRLLTRKRTEPERE